MARDVPVRYRAEWWFHRTRLAAWIRTNVRFRDSNQCPECGSRLPHLTMGWHRDDAANHRWRMPSSTGLPEAVRR
jgi:hypothetical protein